MCPNGWQLGEWHPVGQVGWIEALEWDPNTRVGCGWID